MAREEELNTEEKNGKEILLLVSVIHAVRVLLPGDCIGEILNFQVGLQQFDVQQLALGGCLAIRPHLVQGQVPVVCLDESVHQQWIHIRILRLRLTSCYWA